jgi:hypothetical protein
LLFGENTLFFEQNLVQMGHFIEEEGSNFIGLSS